MKHQKTNRILSLFIIIFVAATFSSTVVAQTQEELSKYQKLVGDRGKIYKLIDIPIEGKLGKYGTLSIRKVKVNGAVTNFLVIGSIGKEAFIHQNDLSAVIRSLEKLISEAAAESSPVENYTENKYVSDDNLKLGYLMRTSGTTNWFITSPKFQYPLEALDPNIMLELFKQAKAKM